MFAGSLLAENVVTLKFVTSHEVDIELNSIIRVSVFVFVMFGSNFRFVERKCVTRKKCVEDLHNGNCRLLNHGH